MLSGDIPSNRPEVMNAINSFVQEITQKYPDKINNVIIYGSVARGEDTRESDVDLLITGKLDDWRFERELINIAFDIGLENGVYLSVKYLPQDRFAKAGSFSFFRTVSEEGVFVVSK